MGVRQWSSVMSSRVALPVISLSARKWSLFAGSIVVKVPVPLIVTVSKAWKVLSIFLNRMVPIAIRVLFADETTFARSRSAAVSASCGPSHSWLVLVSVAVMSQSVVGECGGNVAKWCL